mgnify:FL=1|jgi:predicted regulator of Ras-like GTPase activity (Roadblock/LC7/MglB family)
MQRTKSSMDVEALRERFGAAMLAELKSLTTKNRLVLAAQVCTVDGFELVAVHSDEESRRRLAAMASSIYAVGCAIVNEVRLGTYENLVLEGSNGKVLMMAVPNSDDALLLTAIAAEDALFGHFHYACKTCCENLGRHLVGEVARA